MGDATSEGAFDLLLAGRGCFALLCGFCCSHVRSLLSLAGGHLLVGDGLPTSFTRTGVGTGPLSPDGKTFLVALATVAVDFDKTLDVERAFPTGIAFGVVFGDFRTDGGELFIGEVFDADVFADSGGL